MIFKTGRWGDRVIEAGRLKNSLKCSEAAASAAAII